MAARGQITPGRCDQRVTRPAAGGTSEAPGTVAAHCEAAARRQLLRLVGHRPGRVVIQQGAVGRPRRHRGRDQPPRPRHPARPGRGGRRHRRGRGARRRRHPERGRQRPRRHRHRPGPLPGGSTNVFARTLGLPDDPIEATGVLLDALARGSIRRVGLGLGERPLLPLPRRHRLRRGRGRAGRAARLAQALRRPPALRLGRARHLAAPLRPPPPALRGDGARRRRPSTTATSRSASTPTRTRTSAPGRSTSPPRPTSTGAWPWSPSAASTPCPCSAPRRRRSASGSRLRRNRHVAYRTDVAEAVIDGYGAGALPGRRRLPRRVEHLPPPRARRPPPRHPPLSSRPTRRATSGTSVIMPSTPRAASAAMRSGSSTVQVLTASPAAWAAHERLVDERVPRVDRAVPVPTPRRTTRRGVEARSKASRPVGSSGARARTRSTVARSNDDTSTARATPAPQELADHGAPRGLVGSRSGSRLLISTLTPRPAQASRAASSVGTRPGSVGRGRVAAIARPSGSSASWWTARAPSAVRRTSSSTQSAPSSAPRPEGLDGVLGGSAAEAPGGRRPVPSAG